MPGFELNGRAHLPSWPARRDVGIGVVGAGFIVRDCHLVAHAEAGFPVVGITSRTHDRARDVADARGIARVFPALEAMLEEPAVAIVDIAVPAAEQPAVIRRVLAGGRKVRGNLAQKPLALALSEARALVEECARAGVLLQVNQNMRYDHSVRALRQLLERGIRRIQHIIRPRTAPVRAPGAVKRRVRSRRISPRLCDETSGREALDRESCRVSDRARLACLRNHPCCH